MLLEKVIKLLQDNINIINTTMFCSLITYEVKMLCAYT